MTVDELGYVVDKGDLFALNSEYHPNNDNKVDYNSDLVEKLSKEEIKGILLELLNFDEN